MNHRYLIVATEAELLLPEAVAIAKKPDFEIIVTGVGGTNVVKALRGLSRRSIVYNVGYCGSSFFEVGSVVPIDLCRLYHPNCEFDEETFQISGMRRDNICLTAGDFVTSPKDIPPRAVIDMELAYIVAFGFHIIHSIKYVSDRFNYQEYQTCLKK